MIQTTSVRPGAVMTGLTEFSPYSGLTAPGLTVCIPIPLNHNND